MHGRIFETACTACGDRRMNTDSPICEALRGTEAIMQRHEPEPDIPLDQLPRCVKCGGLLRPGVVWFGEVPLYLDEIQAAVDAADVGLIVGTSSTVGPFVVNLRACPLTEIMIGLSGRRVCCRYTGRRRADGGVQSTRERRRPRRGLSIHGPLRRDIAEGALWT